MNVMATCKTWCFLVAIRWQPTAIPSISTMVLPIRALRWRTAVFAVYWPGWTRMAIRNKLTIEGSGKVRLRFGCQKYYGANPPRRRLEEGQNAQNVSELWEFIQRWRTKIY